MTKHNWQPLGLTDADWADVPEQGGVKWLHLSRRRPRDAGQSDRSATWLRWATAALGILAAAAAVVSFEAQYTMIYARRGNSAIAGLEAAIPDTAALVFACLGIALALHGKRAIRARILNVGAVATSVTMNALAAGPGWRDWAIWVMPPIAYALASDTLIGVVRAHAIATQQENGESLAGDDTTPLTVLAGVLLWTLRLVLAPPSTLSGFRTWVVESCPVAPGRRALPATDVTALPAAPAPGSAVIPSPEPQEPRRPDPYGPARPDNRRGKSKTSRFLQLVEERHGELAGIDPAKVSRISTDLAPLVNLNVGSARSSLGQRVRAAQNGHAS